MTREDMDRAVNEHFGFEAADNVDGVMASLAGKVEHEIVPSPVGVQHDEASVHAYYKTRQPEGGTRAAIVEAAARILRGGAAPTVAAAAEAAYRARRIATFRRRRRCTSKWRV